MKQGYTKKNMLEFGSEIKKRKMIISGLYEVAGENVHAAALECINKVIRMAIADIHPDAPLGGLRVKMCIFILLIGFYTRAVFFSKYLVKH